jgi:hypothetical protein
MNKFVMVIPVAIALAGCDDTKHPTSEQIQRQQQEQISMQGVMTVGMPAITNFAEKRMMKDILELRDQMHPTYTYLYDMNGKIGEKVCDSLGYGLSGSTQYTNPQKVEYRSCPGTGCAMASIAQADPNGLYSPPSTEGTWIMCKIPGSDKIEPQYIEPRIITLTFPKESRK